MDLIEKINRLKEEKNAVILAHYYVKDELQEIADYVGDSFYLAKAAKNTDKDVIAFCGVRFMGESAKILNPEKTVLMPDAMADCPMAHMITAGKIKKMREEYEDLAVVCYINSTAEIKCLSDVCVTSSNAVKIVKAMKEKNIFFIPDGNLGRFVQKQVPEKNIIPNNGFCPTHDKMSAKELSELKAKYPNAEVLSHPECGAEVLKMSDYIGSTSGIIDYAKQSDCRELIICTESGVGYSLRKDSPDKKFIFTGHGCFCPNMKLNSLEKLCRVLETGENEIIMDSELMSGALKPLDRMLELAK